MSFDRRDSLIWQFGLVHRLADIHLPGLTDAACLWEPGPGSWTVRRSEDGNWRPDWSETEPEPAPPVTIGWLSWHLIWWWSALLASMRGETPAPREELFWPGSAAASVERLATLFAEMEAALGEADLDRMLAYPWPEPRPLAQALAWANLELMKNVAEIGVVRHLYEASKA